MGRGAEYFDYINRPNKLSDKEIDELYFNLTIDSNIEIVRKKIQREKVYGKEEIKKETQKSAEKAGPVDLFEI